MNQGSSSIRRKINEAWTATNSIVGTVRAAIDRYIKNTFCKKWACVPYAFNKLYDYQNDLKYMPVYNKSICEIDTTINNGKSFFGVFVSM